MRLLNKETTHKFIVLGIFIGAIAGAVIYFANKNLDMLFFYTFLVIFPIAFIWLKAQNIYYRKIAFGAPNVPISDENLNVIISYLKENNFKNIIDLGSGYGNICLKAAEEGIRITGYEINPVTYAISKLRLLLNNKGNRTSIYFKNFWNVDMGDYDCVVVYGISYVMDNLEKKLIKEMHPNSSIISVYFELPTIKPIKKIREVSIYKI